MTGSYVAFDGITRRWDGKGGVHDISLSVAEGSFVSILGPSGCGKSTLLRLLAGLERPSAGAIHIAGRDVTHLPASQRGLSMVFQSYALFPHLTVRENILFGMKVRRVPRPRREAKLAEALEMMGLEGLEKRKPAALSGGQRQRVALARAVVSGHPLCLMDEPLSNLDAKLRNSVRRDIKALQRNLGLTVIYVTHDQAEAMSLSDQIVLMQDSKIVQTGRPEELYDRPNSVFAAEFIGDPPMAILDGAVLGLETGDQVGIRPEHISLAEPDAADLVARVAACEYLGAETRVILAHPKARGLAVALPGQNNLQIGQEVALGLPQEHRVLFRAAAGAAEKDPRSIAGRASPNSRPVIAERHLQPSS